MTGPKYRALAVGLSVHELLRLGTSSLRVDKDPHCAASQRGRITSRSSMKRIMSLASSVLYAGVGAPEIGLNCISDDTISRSFG